VLDAGFTADFGGELEDASQRPEGSSCGDISGRGTLSLTVGSHEAPPSWLATTDAHHRGHLRPRRDMAFTLAQASRRYRSRVMPGFSACFPLRSVQTASATFEQNSSLDAEGRRPVGSARTLSDVRQFEARAPFDGCRRGACREHGGRERCRELRASSSRCPRPRNEWRRHRLSRVNESWYSSVCREL